LRELEKIDGWSVLEARGAQLETATRETLRELQLPFSFHRIGSMFCLFFSSGAVTDLRSAQQSDREQFARFFRACLDQGIYFAPSQFETGFISTAHTSDAIAQTGAVVRNALAATG
ncbi:MAG: aspartate aminotransferase family protein, partial [Verrucomicrobiota bacterium]|nr:aspartate aminotransferase family protein [Verrucomicrobiota bacterium]